MKVAIITPVGPGHAPLAVECVTSIMNAWNYSRGKFTELELLVMPDLEGQYGRSSRRNSGIDEAIEKGCDWLFFLDADDLMALEAFEIASNYLDDYDAIFGNICEKNPDGVPELRAGQVKNITDYSDILLNDPYLTLQMGHFVKTQCANAIRFDVGMNAGEDFEYYLNLCDQYKFIKIDSVLFVNRRGMHSTGPLSATGGDWRVAVQGLILKRLRDCIANRNH
jgi:hypothetical protein